MGIGTYIGASADLDYWLLYMHCWVAIGLWQVMEWGNWFLALVAGRHVRSGLGMLGYTGCLHRLGCEISG